MTAKNLTIVGVVLTAIGLAFTALTYTQKNPTSISTTGDNSPVVTDSVDVTINGN